MSYTLEPFLVDLAEIRKAVGGGDAELISAVMEYHPEAFEMGVEDAQDEVEEDEEEISMSQALTELISGKLTSPDSAHQYGYALKELCDYLGEDVDRDMWCGVRWIAMEESGLDKIVEGSGSPVPLPDNPGTFPTIGYLTREKVRERVSQLGDDHLTADDDDMQELLDEYEEWLRAAAEQNKDIIFFYY